MAEMYYKRIIRIVEYYIFICFIFITVIPLLEYSWVPGFVKFIYFTGFPLLLLLLVVSLIRDPLIEFFNRRLGDASSPKEDKSSRKR